jgi:hypothetical protein
MQLALYRLGGLAICRQIERIGYATERERPSVEGWDRLRVVGSALVRGLMPRGGIRNVEPA